MLLEEGAEIRFGIFLFFATGVCPPGGNLHARRVTPSEDFDKGRILVMEYLVFRGADSNQTLGPPHREPQYAIACAVRAGAVHRVGLLLEIPADPDAGGPLESTAEYTKAIGSEEMKSVLEAARVHKGGNNASVE